MSRSQGATPASNSTSKVVRLTGLALAAYISSHVSQQAYAQDICNLGERVVELLSTIDACAATGDQLTELEVVRQEVVAPYADIDCAELQEKISELELTMPRRPTGRPATLDQPVSVCEATEKSRESSRVALVESLHE